MVLSSPRLKACYDARGAEGLLEREGWQWDGDAEGVFERFFGTDNPFAALGAMQEATESAAAAGVGGGSRAGKAKVYAIEASLEEPDEAAYYEAGMAELWAERMADIM